MQPRDRNMAADNAESISAVPRLLMAASVSSWRMRWSGSEEWALSGSPVLVSDGGETWWCAGMVVDQLAAVNEMGCRGERMARKQDLNANLGITGREDEEESMEGCRPLLARPRPGEGEDR